MNRSAVTGWIVAVVLLAATAGLSRGQEVAVTCPPELLAPLLQEAVSLLQEAKAKECLELLRPLRACFGKDSRFTMLLSRAYGGTGNLSWAMKVLSDALVRQPEDCTVRARLAWLLLENADYRGALALLAEGTCPITMEEHTRWDLLRAEAELQADRLEPARQRVSEADSRDAMYDEDAGLRSHLLSLLWPMRTPSLELRGETTAGWSSNPLLGSPLDPQASGEDFASWKGGVDVRGRFAGPYWGRILLLAEADLRSQFLAADEAKDLSYVGWGVRPGLEFSWPSSKLVLSYHYDALWLAARDDYGDRGLLFDGHRGELSLQSSSGVYLLAGGGHRTFRIMGRSRYEGDLGLGWGDRLGSRVFLLAGLSGRAHQAENTAYDLRGGTALLALRWHFLHAWSLRASGTLALDWYPESAGSEAFHAPDARQDVLFRGRIGLWSPPFLGGLKAGLQYEPSRRLSSAALFDFSDHTVLLMLGFGVAGDLWHPGGRETPDWNRVDYGLEAGGDGFDERLQDLLRADEESQRGSSCLE